MLRFITGLDVTLCQSPPPPPPAPPPSLPPIHSPFLSPSLSFFSSVSLSVTSSHPLFLSFPPSVFCVSLSLSPSAASSAVLNRGLFVHKHALSWPLPYLLVSRAAVALLCVTAQPCLFSLPGSCLSWLWTSFKACPVSAPRQTHTHTHKHTPGREHTSIKIVFTSQRLHMTPMRTQKQIHTHTHSLLSVCLCCMLVNNLTLVCVNVFKYISSKVGTSEI